MENHDCFLGILLGESSYEQNSLSEENYCFLTTKSIQSSAFGIAKKETNFAPLCAFTLEVKFAVTKRGQFYYITVEVAAVQLSFSSCFINAQLFSCRTKCVFSPFLKKFQFQFKFFLTYPGALLQSGLDARVWFLQLEKNERFDYFKQKQVSDMVFDCRNI